MFRRRAHRRDLGSDGRPGARPIEVLTTPRLYGAGFEELSAVIAEQPDVARSLMVIGHNPGWEEVVSELTGEPVTLGTANAALLSFPDAGAWRDVLHPGFWRLVDVLRPKETHG